MLHILQQKRVFSDEKQQVFVVLALKMRHTCIKPKKCFSAYEKQGTWRAIRKTLAGGHSFIMAVKVQSEPVSEVIFNSLGPYDQLLVEAGLFHDITGFTLLCPPGSLTNTHSYFIPQEVIQRQRFCSNAI